MNVDKRSPVGRQLEAVLFASGDPISLERLSQALHVPPEFIRQELDKLTVQYEAEDSGIMIRKMGENYQMTTRTDYESVIRRAMETKKATPLSAAAMEVLTIIAYNQPVSKGFVEQVRGVDSGTIVNSLVEKELVEEAGRLEIPGHPIAYQTSTHFLRSFGLESLQDLPPLPVPTQQVIEQATEKTQEDET